MIINIPGLHNSGDDHWQTDLEKEWPNKFYRINQKNWDQPDCKTWIKTIEKELSHFTHQELILIGHSIGSIAIIKWLEHYKYIVKAALLVAPSDAESNNYPSYITGFTPIPKSQIPFPTTLVASTNDHVTSLDRSREWAKNWGSKLVVLEDAGHIESSNIFTPWPLIEELIRG